LVETTEVGPPTYLSLSIGLKGLEVGIVKLFESDPTEGEVCEGGSKDRLAVVGGMREEDAKEPRDSNAAVHDRLIRTTECTG
jgi:hypothetical protein